MNVDLPNLTSIDNSGGYSFSNPRSLTLESISEYWVLTIFRHSKSSTCQSSQCIPECSMEINFEYWLIDLFSFIDISTQLSNTVPINCYEILSFNASITSIIIPNWTCNINNYTVFDFSRFSLLESIEIGNNSFGSVSTFQIEGLNQLKRIKIGKNSFTQRKNGGYGNIVSKSFHILNCESLESIQIGEYSFSDYGGEFELKNLTQLQSIHIGNIGNSMSLNFWGSSFVARGIFMILNLIMNRSSNSTIHYIGW